MNMDFTLELDEDEVFRITAEEWPKKKVRIQVESLTVRGPLPTRNSRTGTPKADPDPAWLYKDFEAVVLAHMRDVPVHKVSRDAAAQLEAADFKAKRHAIMFRAIRALMLKQSKVTPTTISEEAQSLDLSLHLPAWFVDSVGGDDDLDPAECLTWMLQRKIFDEK